jgi:hypothetical protein
VITPAGQWMVAYQDATTGELALASRSGDAWTRQTLHTGRAAGFWTSAVPGGGRLFVSHAIIKGEPSRPVTTELRIEVVSP